MQENINILQGKSIQIVEFYLYYDNNQLELKMNINYNNADFTAFFHNVSRVNIQNISAPMNIQGFEVVCNKDKGWAQDSKYIVRDFEDDHLCFFCENIELYNNVKNNF